MASGAAASSVGAPVEAPHRLLRLAGVPARVGKAAAAALSTRLWRGWGVATGWGDSGASAGVELLGPGQQGNAAAMPGGDASMAVAPPVGRVGANELGPAPDATPAIASAMVAAPKKAAAGGLWSASAVLLTAGHSTCAGGASTVTAGQSPAWPAACAAASHASSYVEHPRLKLQDVPTHHLAHWSQQLYTPQPCSGLKYA